MLDRVPKGSDDERSLISLFTGAGGLDIGLEEAGLTTRVAVEVDRWAQATLARNRDHFRNPEFPILGDITAISPRDIIQLAGLERGEAFAVSGGPPCQSFSTAGKRGSLGDPRGGLFANFAAVVDVARPRFFIFENVRGILSAAIRHRPIDQRGFEHPPLEPEEEPGSAFRVILNEFHLLGYQTIYGLVDAADYGVPQNRQRLVLLGSRDWEFTTEEIEDILVPTHRGRWRTLRDAIGRINQEPPEFLRYSPDREDVMRVIPEGANWRWLRDNAEFGPEFTRQVMGGAWSAGGGKVGFFRRLAWGKPSPTLPTSPIQKSTSLCHPEETRPLSVQEYAAVQQFPIGYEFVGRTAEKYRQIGNAVPIGLGRAIGNGLDRVVNSDIEARVQLRLLQGVS